MNFKNVFKKVLSFSTLVVSKIPTREDTKYSSAIKIASLVDFMVDEFYENNIPLQRFIQNLGNDIIKSKDKEFEKFLFKNGFDKLFDLKSHRLTDSNIGIPIDIIELKNKQYGNLYFISYSSWCDKQEFDFFFYSKGFDFKSIFDLLWKDLNNNIHISCIYESLLDSKNIEYSEIKKDNGFVFNKKTQEKIDKFVGLYLNYKKDFVSRKYLFYGLPGNRKNFFCNGGCK